MCWCSYSRILINHARLNFISSSFYHFIVISYSFHLYFTFILSSSHIRLIYISLRSSFSMTFISVSSVRNRKTLTIRWKKEDVQLIVHWFCERDESEVSINLNLFQKDNKIEMCKRLLNESELRAQRSDVFKEKTRDKMRQMMKQFKKTRSLTETTKWKVNIIKQNVVTNNIREQIIKEIILKKCSYYYELENIMNDLSIISSSFIMKSIRSNSFSLENDQLNDQFNSLKITSIISALKQFDLN